MLYKCANESCNTPFRRLREGKLFQVETEYFAGRGPSPLTRRKARPTRRVDMTEDKDPRTQAEEDAQEDLEVTDEAADEVGGGIVGQTKWTDVNLKKGQTN